MMEFQKLTDIFPVHGTGIVTGRDKLTIKENEEKVYTTVLNLSRIEDTVYRELFSLNNDTRDWVILRAQQDLIKSGIDRQKIVPILYRPFDIRYTYYSGNSRGFHSRPQPGVMKHMLRENIGLITARKVTEREFSHCFVSDTIVESRLTASNRGICYLFPLYLYDDSSQRKANVNGDILKILSERAGFKTPATAEQVFYYIYALLFSRLFWKTYASRPKMDFSHVPFPADKDLFAEMAILGEQLVKVHLLRSPELHQNFSKFEVAGETRVEKLKYNEFEKKVYINRHQYFSNIDKEIWEYQICGYPVMSKWLKDRRKRTLSGKDILHYIKIARALQLTLQYQSKIDRLFSLIDKAIP
ncbi:MAG: hypothetical protein PVH61_05425 [Candidatus Aminicenantes bacterium]|jgi:predicted helicase